MKMKRMATDKETDAGLDIFTKNVRALEKELKPQVRPYEQTLSAFTVLKKEFFDKK